MQEDTKSTDSTGGENETVEEIAPEEFDPERALNTIRAQRAEEKRLKEELAEARKAQEELARIKTEQEEADKTAQQKLAEREAEIASLKQQIAENAVKADFMRIANSEERAYLDPELAYFAAREQGLLGKYDPKTGKVEGHNLDKLEELYPALAGERNTVKAHDAGVRGKPGKTGSPGAQFNTAVRSAISRRY